MRPAQLSIVKRSCKIRWNNFAIDDELIIDVRWDSCIPACAVESLGMLSEKELFGSSGARTFLKNNACDEFTERKNLLDDKTILNSTLVRLLLASQVLTVTGCIKLLLQGCYACFRFLNTFRRGPEISSVSSVFLESFPEYLIFKTNFF